MKIFNVYSQLLDLFWKLSYLKKTFQISIGSGLDICSLFAFSVHV